MTSIITQIWDRGVQIFDAAETWIDTQAAAIKKALPGAAATIDAIAADAKQAASDAIGMADSALAAVAPVATKAVEAAADAALTTYTGGLALPLTPLTNDGIEQVENLIVTTANSWALKAKALLAANNGNAVASATGPAPQ